MNSPTPHPPRLSSRLKRAFTLMELLAVVATVALLAALLIPGFQTMLTRAEGAKCMANLRQIGSAVAAYTAEHDGAFPRGGWGGAGSVPLDPPGTDGVGWLTDIFPYLNENRAVFICPAGSETSPTGELSTMRMPGKTMADPRYPSHYGYNAQLNTNRESLRNNTPPLHVDRVSAVKRLSSLPVLIDIVFQSNFLGYDSMFLPSPPETQRQAFSGRHAGAGNILWGDGAVSTMTPAQWASAPEDRGATGGWKYYQFCMGDY